MEVFFIYLWMSLPAFFTAAAVLLGMAVLSVVEIAISRESLTKKFDLNVPTSENLRLKKLQIKVTKLAILPACFLVFVPGQTTVAAMVVTHYAVESLSSAEGKKVVSLLRMTMNNYLDKELAAAQPKK